MRILKNYWWGLLILGVIILVVIIYLRYRKVKIEYIYLDDNWSYADYSEISSGRAILYNSNTLFKRNKIVAINAGHGTLGGESKKTYCHPDKSPKVTGGSTAVNSIKATAISEGTTLLDGRSEAELNLVVARLLKDKLLANGYEVLMLRDDDDVQLDNIARSVIANNIADIHVSIHFDDSALDNGAYYISVPLVESYLSMYPVSEYYEKHNELGEILISGLEEAGVKINANRALPIDLTQTSFSTIPSVVVELGDKKTNITDKLLKKYADGLFYGISDYFNK